MSDIHIDDAADTALRHASPGELLQRERETQGLAREEIASALNLRPAVIRGLENDSYEEVPVAAYRRGYLRSYAHLLGIDDRPILEAYQARFGSAEAEQRVTPVQITRPPSRLGAWLFRLVTLLVIAGLVGLTLLWWQSRGGNQPPDITDSGPVSVDSLDGGTAVSEDDGATNEALPPLPEEDSDLGLIDDAPPVAASGDTGADDAAASGDAPAAPAEPEAGEEAATEEEAATGEAATTAPEQIAEAPAEAERAADPRVLELTFNEQSWTEIFDADDQRVFVGLQEPGTTARVEGEPPFRLTVGNATGVELNWRGEPVDLEARAGANNVARFTLGE